MVLTNQYCMVLVVVDLFIIHSIQIPIINKCIHLSLPFVTINKLGDCGIFDVICRFSLELEILEILDFIQKIY